MISPTTPRQMFEEILISTNHVLGPVGFKRRSSTFRLIDQGNCGIIDFQRSDKSSSEKLIFTVNICVVCGELLDGAPSQLDQVPITSAHLRHRVGKLLPGRPDKWWELSSPTTMASVSQEVISLIETQVVPYIKKYLSTNELIELWRTGQAPGLTAIGRDQFLLRLQKRRS